MSSGGGGSVRCICIMITLGRERDSCVLLLYLFDLLDAVTCQRAVFVYWIYDAGNMGGGRKIKGGSACRTYWV